MTDEDTNGVAWNGSTSCQRGMKFMAPSILIRNTLIHNSKLFNAKLPNELSDHLFTGR